LNPHRQTVKKGGGWLRLHALSV